MDAKDNVDDSESIASDESEEMTEVDEDEVDLKRSKYLADMKDLEQQYGKLKEEYIDERFKVVDQKLKEIEEETAEEFTKPLKQLQMNMEFKTNFSTLMKDYRLKNIKHIYDCEVESDKLTLENNINSLIEKNKSKIENEILHLEESRRQYLLEYEIYQLDRSDCQETEHKSDDKTKNDCKKMKNVPVLLTGTPYVVYTLPENDILEDLSMIKMHNNLSKIFNNSES